MSVNQEALNKLGVKPFDVAEHFRDEEFMRTYLKEILADGDAEELAEALFDIARYKGRSAALEAEGFTLPQLVEQLADAVSSMDVVNRVLAIVGVDLQLRPFVTETVVDRRGPPATTRSHVFMSKRGLVMGRIKYRNSSGKKEPKKIA